MSLSREFTWAEGGRVQRSPVRIECEGGSAAWLVGTLAVPSVQRHRLLPPQELWPYQSLFSGDRFALQGGTGDFP